MGEVRNPIRESSIFKKNKIIDKGFELMCNEGYHNVNCVDIAKYASVSTGIIYQYFCDKLDIFIEGVKKYSDKIMFPVIEVLDKYEFQKNNLEKIINDIMDIFINTHTISKRAHEELMAMSHTNNHIREIFNDKQEIIIKKISKLLQENNIFITHEYEKIEIMANIVESYTHDYVYNFKENYDYNIMKKEVINTCMFLLGERNEKV